MVQVAVSTRGEAISWGQNDFGQLGRGVGADNGTPAAQLLRATRPWRSADPRGVAAPAVVSALQGHAVVQVRCGDLVSFAVTKAGGLAHACVRACARGLGVTRAAGLLYGWGGGETCQLAREGEEDMFLPTPIKLPGGAPVSQISVSATNCAARDGALMRCDV